MWVYLLCVRSSLLCVPACVISCSHLSLFDYRGQPFQTMVTSVTQPLGDRRYSMCYTNITHLELITVLWHKYCTLQMSKLRFRYFATGTQPKISIKIFRQIFICLHSVFLNGHLQNCFPIYYKQLWYREIVVILVIKINCPKIGIHKFSLDMH